METSNTQLMVPLSILGAGVIIAGAILFTAQNNNGDQLAGTGGVQEEAVSNISSVTPKDHILGNFETAEIFIVEFSDLECPFCRSFHQTLKQVMEAYGPDSKVAWVYRHFPLTAIHPKAFQEAVATECAAELGGELKFWEYTDQLLEVSPLNNGLDLTLLPQIAEDVGLDRDAFVECLESGRQESAVNEDMEDAVKSGGRGTPHTILITKDGKNSARVQGAQPFDALKAQIDQLLSE